MRNLALAVYLKVKVKVKVKVASHAVQAQMVEHRHSSTLSLTSALDGSGLSTSRPGRFTPSKEPVPVTQEAGRVPKSIRTGVKNLAPIKVRTPNRPARSESLY